MKKTVCYARVSRVDMNPENQRRDLEKKAKELEAYFELLTERESTRNTRPVKEEILSMCRQGSVNCIIVWKLDRFARSMSELTVNLAEFKKLGIRFISIRDGLDLDPKNVSAIQEFQFHILSAFAQLERDIISERTLAGLERAKAQGKVLGRPKGAKDKKVRRKSGYWLRYANKGK